MPNSRRCSWRWVSLRSTHPTDPFRRIDHLGSSKKFGGSTDRGDDVVIAGAAAQIAGQELPDAGIGEIERTLLFETPDDVHHHARGAVAALQAVAFLERLLNGLQRAI